MMMKPGAEGEIQCRGTEHGVLRHDAIIDDGYIRLRSAYTDEPDGVNAATSIGAMRNEPNTRWTRALGPIPGLLTLKMCAKHEGVRFDRLSGLLESNTPCDR